MGSILDLVLSGSDKMVYNLYWFYPQLLSSDHSIISFEVLTVNFKHIPYSCKFSRVLIFAVFTDQSETAKIATANLLTTRMHITHHQLYGSRACKYCHVTRFGSHGSLPPQHNFLIQAWLGH